LVELGIIKPGTTIFDNKKKISAKIMADGSIKHAQTEGSIHKVAATILVLKVVMDGLIGIII
jgi:site-specific DNA-methyltransferase (adenine-specific)/modification methylase